MHVRFIFFGVPLLPFLKLDASSSKELALSFYLDGFPCVTAVEQSVNGIDSGSGAVEAEKTIVGPLKHFNVFLVLFGGFPCKALNVKLCLYK